MFGSGDWSGISEVLLVIAKLVESGGLMMDWTFLPMHKFNPANSYKHTLHFDLVY